MQARIYTFLGIGLALLLVGLILLGRSGKRTPAPSTVEDTSPTTKWSLQVSNGPLSEPALGEDGTVYVGGRDGLYAIAPGGTLSWRFTTLADPVRGAPSIAPDGTVYFGTGRGGLYGIAPDGQESWHPQLSIFATDGTPAFGHSGSLFATNNAGDVYAFNPAEEDQPLWNWNTMREGATSDRAALPGSGRSTDFRSKASPAIGTDAMVYVPRRDWLHSFNPNGEIAWSIQLPGAFLGPVAVGADGTIYVGSQRVAWLAKGVHGARLYAVDRYGRTKWELDMPAAVVGAPAIDNDGLIYVCAGRLLAVTPEGRLKWEFQARGSCTSGPTLAADGTIYLGWTSDQAWQLVAVTSAGELKWGTLTKGIVRAAPAISPDGVIYVATERGDILALWDAGAGLMISPWPKYQHDARNTGRFSAPR